MVSHKYKCIFVEVPKTGSSSIRSVIGKPLRPHQNIMQIKQHLESDGGYKYALARRFYGYFPEGHRCHMSEKWFASYFKFGFVRNPWDRTVSLYKRKEGIQMADQMSFEQFVEWITLSSDTCIQPTSHKNQLDWFLDGDGKVAVDYIGRFESLQADWEYVAKQLKINGVELPHRRKNPTKDRHYTEYYIDKTKDIIAQKFEIDIAYFGYEFGVEAN